jgi:hypothetical protein
MSGAVGNIALMATAPYQDLETLHHMDALGGRYQHPPGTIHEQSPPCLPACMCRDSGGQPTDWLEALPQSTLIDVMQRRCRLLVAVERHRSPSNQPAFITGVTKQEMIQLESRMST